MAIDPLKIEPLSVGIIILGVFLCGEIVKHAIAYFWRMLTKQDKYITKQDLRLQMQDILKDFNKSWCGLCDTKRDKAAINCLIVKVDAIKKLLLELCILAKVDNEKIAVLTQSGQRLEEE